MKYSYRPLNNKQTKYDVRFQVPMTAMALMMEAVHISETPYYFNKLKGAASQKAVVLKRKDEEIYL
jgi:hypothetical protein